ncbi:hypothetical protein L218DRAFT_458366 [Marasmius fiardii PR-910]|nr:hypothetical protein L218DRAFT_458366 [Marasmius fiardii PR-910]
MRSPNLTIYYLLAELQNGNDKNTASNRSGSDIEGFNTTQSHPHKQPSFHLKCGLLSRFICY